MKYHKGLAYEQLPGDKASIIFCGGLGSSMYGVKASALYNFCKRNDIGFTRFDYSGCGLSEGDIHSGNISVWLKDAINVLCDLTDGKQIIIGSSMGGWIMLLIAIKYPDRVKALIGIAAAPDFSRDIYDSEQLKSVQSNLEQKNASSVDALISPEFISDANKHCILDSEIPIYVPVELLHGMQDEVVPYTKSLELAQKLKTDSVSINLLKSSNHSMNDDNSLACLYNSLLRLL